MIKVQRLGGRGEDVGYGGDGNKLKREMKSWDLLNCPFISALEGFILF